MVFKTPGKFQIGLIWVWGDFPAGWTVLPAGRRRNSRGLPGREVFYQNQRIPAVFPEILGLVCLFFDDVNAVAAFRAALEFGQRAVVKVEGRDRSDYFIAKRLDR